MGIAIGDGPGTPATCLFPGMEAALPLSPAAVDIGFCHDDSQKSGLEMAASGHRFRRKTKPFTRQTPVLASWLPVSGSLVISAAAKPWQQHSHRDKTAGRCFEFDRAARSAKLPRRSQRPQFRLWRVCCRPFPLRLRNGFTDAANHLAACLFN